MQFEPEGVPNAISYISRRKNGLETRYSATDSEGLIVVEVVRAFDPSVYDWIFAVYTDHRPLVYVFTRKTKSLRMS